MKGMDLFCSSPASTAVISCMDVHPNSTVRPTPKTRVPCSSSLHLPSNPRPYSYFQKHRKSSAEKENDAVRRNSCVELNELYSSEYRTGSSRRHLLGDAPFVDWVSRPESHDNRDGHSPVLESSSSVVVLRVSLHCKGCVAKVRKHISKMEGVTSFSIDIETKKVIIMGDVTPLSVLNSVSKVRRLTHTKTWHQRTIKINSENRSKTHMGRVKVMNAFCEGVAQLCHKVRCLISFPKDMDQLSIPMTIYQNPNPLHQRRTRVSIINSIRKKLQSNLRVTLDRYLTKAFIPKHLQAINNASKLGSNNFATTNPVTKTEEEVTRSVAGNAATNDISNRLEVRAIHIALHSIMI
ncbi:protein SODIUM POTASSIUM ROOT DEFECTIVE 2 [Senna tora]|uniref:Protein SODIUM POTASSIUM ROOT DEFECTIVE 2 n=1 Tax=Senna tora TaxID=362788 RepID=A0A834TMD2_9FABA|nr:protein SODIUM POTASSIUM ROOT DEFECTIVE 2 [Senna tora]